MTLTIEKYFTTESGDEMFLEFDCKVTPGTADHFCNGHGNWLPGDDAKCEVTEIRWDGAKVPAVVHNFILGIFVNDVVTEAFKQIESAA